MNRIYRLVYNRTLGVMQVASELVARPHSGTATSAATPLPNGLPTLTLALAISAAIAPDARAVDISDGIQQLQSTSWTENHTIKSGGAYVQSGSSLSAGSVTATVESSALIGAYYGNITVGTLNVLAGGRAYARGDTYQGVAKPANLTVQTLLHNAGTLTVYSDVGTGSAAGKGNIRITGAGAHTSSGSIEVYGGSFSLSAGSLTNTGTIYNNATFSIARNVGLISTTTFTNDTSGKLSFYQSGAGDSLLRSNIANNGQITVYALGADGTSSNFNPGTISGSGTVIFNGDSQVVFNSANTYSGGTTLSGTNASNLLTLKLLNAQALGTGKVNLGANSVLEMSTGSTPGFGAVEFRGGTVAATAGTTTRITVDERSDTGTAKTIRVGTSGNTGTVVLSAGATAPTAYDINVAAGSMRYGTGMGTVATGRTATLASGSTLDLDDGNASIGNLQGAGTVDTGSGTLTLDGTGSDHAGAIQGTTGGVLAVTAGEHALSGDISTPTVRLTGANTRLVLSGSNSMGAVSATAGTLALHSNAAAGGAAGRITAAGATLEYADGVSVATPITLGSAGTKLHVASGSATQSGIIGDGGNALGLSKTGTGTLVLSADNTYTGDTTVSAGLLNITGKVASDTIRTSGAGSVSFGSGALKRAGTVEMTGTGTFSLTGSMVIEAVNGQSGNTLSIGENWLTLGEMDSDSTFAGAVTGSGGLILSGGGSLTLSSNASTFSGYLTGDIGTLNLTGTMSNLGQLSGRNTGIVNLHGSSVSSSTAVFLAETAQLNLNGNEDVGTLHGGSGNRISLGTSTLTSHGTGTGSTTFAGVITGTGAMVFAGSADATQVLSGANTYSGQTRIQAGTLDITGSIASTSVTALGTAKLKVDGQALADTATVGLEDSARLILSGSEVIGSLAGTSGTTVELGANTLTAGGNNSSTTFAGVLTGSGGLVKSGTGTLTLSGTNLATGTLDVQAGVLHLTGVHAGDVEVGTGGTLSGTGTVAGDLSVAGTLSAGASPGTLTVAGDLELLGTSTSVFELGQAGVVGGLYNDLVRVGGDLELAGTLQAHVAAAGYYRLFNYDGALSGDFTAVDIRSASAGFNIASHALRTGTAGQVNLSILGAGQSMQFWDGSNTVANGSIEGGSGTLGNFGANWTNEDGDANQGWAGSVGVFAGAAGTVTVDGSVDFDTLQFASDGYVLEQGTLALGAPSGRAATLTVDAGMGATVSSALVDGLSTALAKRGNGTLVLSGVNTYTGATSVHEGILEIRGGAALADTTHLSLANGTTLRVGADETIGQLTASGATLTSSGGSTLDVHDGFHLRGGRLTGGLEVNSASFGMSGDALVDAGSVVNSAGAMVLNGGTIRGSVSGTTATLDSGTTHLRDQGHLATRQILVSGTAVLETDGEALSPTASLQLTDRARLDLLGGSERITSLEQSGGTINGTGQEPAVLQISGHFHQLGGATTGSLWMDVASFRQSGGALLGAGTTVTSHGAQQLSGGTIDGILAGDGAVTVDQALTEVGAGGHIASSTINLTGTGILRTAGDALASTAAVQVGSEAALELGGSESIASLHSEGRVELADAEHVLGLSADSQLGGSFTGQGGLHLTGGTTRVTSALGYTGSTHVDGARLELGGALASERILIGQGGHLQAAADTLATGARVEVASGGGLALGGNQAVNSLQAEAGSRIDLSSHMLGLAGESRISGTLTGTGGLSVTDARLQLDQPALAFTGNLDLHASTAVLLPTGDTHFGARLAGDGTVLMQGVGALTLEADSSAFSGRTEVHSGTLTLAPAAQLGGTVVVGSDARLTGTGRLGHLDLAGTLETGHSIGTLNVNGDVILRSGSRWNLETEANGQHDQLRVGGKVTIEGGTVFALASGERWAPATNYVVLKADGGISGQFSEASSNLAFLDARLRYSSNSITLSLLRNDLVFTDIADTANQYATASALEGLDHDNAVFDELVLLEAQQARDAYDALSGEIHATTRGALLQDRTMQDAIQRRLGGQVLGVKGERGSLWLSTHAGSAEHDGDGNGARSTRRDTGAVFGADWQVRPNLTLGAALGAQRLDQRLDARASHSDTNARMLGVYAQANVGALGLDASFAHHDYDVDSRRTVAFGTRFSESIRASADASAQVGQLGASWTVGVAGVQLQPFVSLVHTRLDTKALAEHGGASALAVSAGKASLTRTSAGLRGHWDTRIGADRPLRLDAGLAWERFSGDLDQATGNRLLTGDRDFQTSAAVLGDRAARVDLGASLGLGVRSALRAGVEIHNGDARRQTGAHLSWRMGF